MKHLPRMNGNIHYPDYEAVWWINLLNVLIHIQFIILIIYLWTFMHLFNFILYEGFGFDSAVGMVWGIACWSLIVLVDGSLRAGASQQTAGFSVSDTTGASV